MNALTQSLIRIFTSLIVLATLLGPSLAPPMPVKAAPTITFDGSPGAGAPPATLGPYHMLPFPDDDRPSGIGHWVMTVPGPSYGPGDISFNDLLEHDEVPGTWYTWSHGYHGDVYFRPDTYLTIHLPAGTLAFYFYLEPNYGTPNFIAAAQDGTNSGLVSINSNSDARYFGFYAQGGAELSSILIACPDCSPFGFAVGEFGINGLPVDLSIEKTAVPEIGFAGQEQVYRLTATNTGPNDDHNVVITDHLPTGASYLGATLPCTHLSGTVTCQLGNLAIGESKDFLIKTRLELDLVASQADGTLEITNTTSVSGIGSDLNPGNNTSSVTSLVQDLADLRVTKVIEPEMEVQAGQTMTYTVFVDNLGPSYARNVKLTDQLLSSGQFSVVNIYDDPNRNDSCVPTPILGTSTSSSSINCSLTNPLEPVGSSGLTGRWTVKIILLPTTASDISGVTDVFSSEDISGNPGTPDPDLSNNQTVDFVPVRLTADLQTFSVFEVEAQVDGFPGKIIDTNLLPPMPAPPNYDFGGTTVTAGRRIQWDTSVTNTGPSIAQNTRIEVSLPYGASLIEDTLIGSPNPGQVPGRCYTEPPGDLRRKVICEYGSLEVGTTGSLRFQVLIDPSLSPGTQLSLDSCASSETFDSNLGNNLTSIQLDANNWADLAVQKSGNSATIPAGSITSYDIIYQHKGPSTAHEVILTDLLPPGLTPLGVDIIDGNLASTDCFIQTGDPAMGDSVACELGDLLPGVSGKLVVKALVKPDAASGTVTNTVTINSSTPDPFTSDNTDTFDTTIDTSADLEVVKSGGPDKVKAGGEVKFTLKVTNHGPSDAHDVQVTDTLPSEMSYETSNLPGPTMLEGILIPQSNRSLTGQIRAPESDSDCQLASSDPDVVTCTISTLHAGQTRVIEIYALVDPDVLPGVELVNYAKATSSTPDPDLENNQDDATTYLLGVDLAITKTALGQVIDANQSIETPDQVSYGFLLTYHLAVSNQGYTTAQNVVVTDKLPGEVVLLSVASSQGQCTSGVPGDPSLPITCNLGSLAGQETVDITMQVRIPDGIPAGTLLYNEAQVKNDLFDPNNSNDIDVNYTTVVAPEWLRYYPFLTFSSPPPPP